MNKYGRLFTERDVFEMLETLVPASEAQRIVAESVSTFPPDEPLFLLRGQDIQAIDTLIEYKHNVMWGSPAEHVAAVGKAITAFHEWRAVNPDRVKVPD